MICECGEFIRENDYLCPVCHRDTLKELEELRVKCEKYREALEFYGDKNNWSYVNQHNKTLMKDDHDFNVNFSDKFGGKRARKALKDN